MMQYSAYGQEPPPDQPGGIPGLPTIPGMPPIPGTVPTIPGTVPGGAVPGYPPMPGPPPVPGLPGEVPQPAIPGYVTEEACTAAALQNRDQFLAEQAATKRACLRNSGIALVVGWGIGYFIARKMKK